MNQIINSSESTVDPLEIGSSVSNLGFDEFSVGDSSVVNTTVGVGDAGEVGDGCGEILFLLIVLFSKFGFFVINGGS